MEYQRNSHCKFLIAIHLILVVKYRRELLKGELGLVMKNALMSLSQNSEFEIEQMEVDQDHLPILMTISPRYSVSQYVRRIKQHTTRVVWQLHPKLKRQFWKEKTFWSDGYFACSVGNASAETVRKYIQDQG
ncbi:hypothetical protein BCT86_18310 [Vibrio breoganii]|uniref:Transposase IS200-like domain-containing protein n=2 Tax=Vibrio breoganii TaxID=553239 RepID=A0AAJ3S791_9VIBR|nr:IS200/IS605 family transposase [Vibrio breoganii]ANO34958.1 hypothetical protein A6E01_17425 [Vibrio breoganii]OEF87301.1 hypothetical protein B003_03660 [Vibrio breoganii 1C10]PMG76600.1 hypothetical protein BCU83_16380 [Vibrio breoganii]PMH15377.1 hypothetical protein BCU74_02925 [Vibrio breoganii]PMK56629.1 hypothetical protein BCT98_09505 [Vibrio breoganii]